MKLAITIGILVFSTIGGLIGQFWLDNGNFFGGWSILFSTIGGLFGIWVGYKIYRDYL